MIHNNITVKGKPLFRGCSTGKIQHTTLAAAEAHADGIEKKDGHRPNIYTCDECGYLHVGGGRRSDQPLHLPKPGRTPWRETVQKKIDVGKTLSVEDLILSELIYTFKSDKEIAAHLCLKNIEVVTAIRKQLDVPTAKERRQEHRNELLLKLLQADPKRNRRELAKIGGCSLSTIDVAVRKLGFVGTGVKYRSGPRHPRWGVKLSKETKDQISQSHKQLWQDEKTKARLIATQHVFTPEEREASHRAQRHPVIRERSASKARKMWKDPEKRNKTVAGLIKGHNTPEYLEKRSAITKKMMVERPDLRAAAGVAMEKRWENPAFAAKVRVAVSKSSKSRKWTDESRAKVSAANRKRWAETPERRKQVADQNFLRTVAWG
jgi:hypothetical protein